MPRFRRGWLADAKGVVALEFAIVAIPFLSLILFVFELSYAFFAQSTLDTAIETAARQLQTGNAQNVLSGNDFITRYLCPDVGTLLSCSNLYVRVQRISPSSTQDYYDFTTGLPPVSGGVLNLAAYASASFCNPGPAQLLLISVVYAGPTFLGTLLPGNFAVSYNGQMTHPTFSSVGIVSENYAPTAANGAAPAC